MNHICFQDFIVWHLPLLLTFQKDCVVSFQKFLHIISRNAFRKRWHRRWRSQEEGQEGHKWSLCCEYSSMFVTSTTASDFQIQLNSWNSSNDKKMSLEINFYCSFQELCCSYFTFDDREKSWDQERDRKSKSKSKKWVFPVLKLTLEKGILYSRLNCWIFSPSQ